MSISIECDVHIAELQIYNSELKFFRFINFVDKGKTPEIEYTDSVHENPHQLQVTSLRTMNRQQRS